MSARVIAERVVSAHSKHSPKSDLRFVHPERTTKQFGLNEGMRVADFGAGSGAYAKLLADAVGSSGRVYAVDIQKDLLKRIKSNSAQANIDVIWGDVEVPGGVKLADRHLDAVLVSNLLFQVERKESLVREAKRVLKNHGLLILIDWSDSFRGMGPTEGSVVTKPDARALFEAEGFTFEREFDAGAHHYGLLMRSPKRVQ